MSTLDNGVRVITEVMPHVRSVSVGIWIGSGSRRESTEQNGISHFIEHMLFKGTTSRSAEDIARSVDALGGNLDAFTAKELVCFNTKVLDQHLSQAFDVLADLVLHPMFREEDIEKEKGVILEEIKMEEDSPGLPGPRDLLGQFLEGSRAGQADSGHAAERAALRQHHGAGFLQFGLRAGERAGDGGRKPDPRGADRRWSGSTSNRCRRAMRRPPSRLRARTPGLPLRNKKSLEQVHLCLGVPSYPLPHQERFACYVLNTLLGGGMSSRLFQNIRERQGLAYAVFSELNPYRDTGCLSIYAGTSVESARKVVESITKEFRELKEQQVGDEELRRAKDHLKGSLMLGLESTGSRMSNLARQEMYFGKFFTLDELLESIEIVTADDVRRIAQTFFDPKQIALTILGNLEKFKIGRDDLGWSANTKRPGSKPWPFCYSRNGDFFFSRGVPHGGAKSRAPTDPTRPEPH